MHLKRNYMLKCLSLLEIKSKKSATNLIFCDFDHNYLDCIKDWVTLHVFY